MACGGDHRRPRRPTSTPERHMPGPRSKVPQKTPLRDRAMRATVAVELVRSNSPTDDDVEEALLAFDPDDELAAIIAMPPTIPATLRTMITDAVCARFEFSEDLDGWLHSPSIVLGGATPFDHIALGDGVAVLRALGIAAPTTTAVAGRGIVTNGIGARGGNRRPARKRTATPRVAKRR